MFFELEYDNEFKRAYFEMLKYRLAYGSLELEGYNDDLANIKQSMQIYNQLQAINYAFEEYRERDFSHFEFTNILCEIEKRVSGEEIVNFRTTDAIVMGSNVPRTKAPFVRNALWYLIDDYNYMLKNCKTEKDFYELEALFHIRLLHIHPFDDGNGRTARILLAYNLCKHDLAPCIITKEIKKKYCDLIENGDYKRLAEMFEVLSKKELDVMVSLYQKLNEKGLIKMPTEEQQALILKKQNNIN